MGMLDTDNDKHISEEEFMDWMHAEYAKYGAPPLNEE
tara:strand:+ start:243 stop:353 length:111 start_codon:yes stop_codon:yes gene_type:complete